MFSFGVVLGPDTNRKFMETLKLTQYKSLKLLLNCLAGTSIVSGWQVNVHV